MTWTPLLLTDASPSLRFLVLRDLLNRSETDEEIQELKRLQNEDPIIKKITDLQNEDGSWRPGEGGGEILGDIRLTAHAMMALGYFGLDKDNPVLKKGANFLFDKQLDDGSWPLITQGAVLDGGKIADDVKYHMMPVQTAFPLLGLAWSGFSTDPRAERAYDWLVAEELKGGGWPSGKHKDEYVFAAGYRRLAHSKFGCRTNTTAAVNALALHPERRFSESSRRGLDLLLAHEHRQAHNLGFEVARIIGTEPVRGGFTYFKRYDVAQMLSRQFEEGKHEVLGELDRTPQSPYVVRQAVLKCLPEEIEEFEKAVRQQILDFFVHYANITRSLDEAIQGYLGAS